MKNTTTQVAYALEIKLKGETPEQLWSSLLGLVCYACECKQAQGGRWPLMVSTDDGKISVRHNADAQCDCALVALMDWRD